MDKYKEIISHFAVSGNITDVAPLGNGLINDTYIARTDGSESYVLQRINNTVFNDVPLLQRNVYAITRHIHKKLQERGPDDIDRRVLRYIDTVDGGTFYYDGEKYWRVSVYIPGTKSFDTVTPELAYLTGKSFGDFQYMLSDLPEPLGETIPDFHNIEYRLWQLDEAVENDSAGRLDSMREIIEELNDRREEMCKVQQMSRRGEFPKRITHCDTKVNNMLFDADGTPLCVIDLDTTMPGFVLSDFGDFIRTAGNTGKEDDTDLRAVGVNMEIFKSFARGYIEGAERFITPVEKEHLPFGAKLMAYMQTVRFLADYLNGDTYYKTAYPEHNRQRTLAQYKLLRSLEAHEDEMKRYIATL